MEKNGTSAIQSNIYDFVYAATYLYAKVDTLAHVQRELRDGSRRNIQCCADLPTNLMF